jgi:hypothetical protein
LGIGRALETVGILAAHSTQLSTVCG